jgi:hypothetical protein
VEGHGNDTVWKIRGDDTINLDDGDDNLWTTSDAGGSGADGLYGSSEDDRLYGDQKGKADDFIAQGATPQGNGLQGEWFDAEDGDEQLFGGAGNDLAPITSVVLTSGGGKLGS